MGSRVTERLPTRVVATRGQAAAEKSHSYSGVNPKHTRGGDEASLPEASVLNLDRRGNAELEMMNFPLTCRRNSFRLN